MRRKDNAISKKPNLKWEKFELSWGKRIYSDRANAREIKPISILKLIEGTTPRKGAKALSCF